MEGDDLVDTDTYMEHVTVCDNEEVEKKINKNLTTMIVHEKSDTSEEADA